MPIEIRMTGLVGIARDEQKLTALMVDARDPSQLPLPRDVRSQIKDAHVPRLLFRQAELVSSDLPSQEDAHSCVEGGAWTAIDIADHDVSLPSLTGPDLTWGKKYDLLSLREITQPLAGSAADKEMDPSVLQVPYRPNGNSRISARVHLDKGEVTTELGRDWAFDGQASRRTVYRLVVVRCESSEEVVIECRALRNPRQVKRVILRGANCEILFENNPPAQDGGDTCRGDRDFVALYTLLRNPLALGSYPAPRDTGGGYAGDAQCSPAETKP